MIFKNNIKKLINKKKIINYFFIIVLLYLFIKLKFKAKIFLFIKNNNNISLQNNKKQIFFLNKTEIINNYYFSLPSEYDNEKRNEIKKLDKLLSLKTLSKDKNKNNYFELKMKLLAELNTLRKGKNFTNIEAIFIVNPGYFGNRMIMLNNIIFYFEILNITNIYLNSKYNWIIKNRIITDKIKIFLINPSKIDCNSINIICISFEIGFLFFPIIIKPELRINILKYEIKRNLPNVEIDPKALYIHIRSGDIFTTNINSEYAQPPLCFYQKILYKFTFTKIYLISGSNNNPIINKLLIEFPNIFFKKNDIVQSIAYLSNAYNLVGSISSFLLMSIRLNNNLKIFWEYDLLKISLKFIFFHFDIYSNSINFIIYRMKPSQNYRNEMFVWRNDQRQIKLMIEEKCINKFYIIKPNIK